MEDEYEDFDAQPTLNFSIFHRTSMRLVTSTDVADHSLNSDNDFVGLMTCVSELYSQEGVLEMKEIKSSSETAFPIHASGAVSSVSRLNATFTQPSDLHFNELKSLTQNVIVKRYPGTLFHPSGKARDQRITQSLLTEVRVLSHAGLRKSAHIVKILGIQWDYTAVVRNKQECSSVLRTSSTLTAE